MSASGVPILQRGSPQLLLRSRPQRPSVTHSRSREIVRALAAPHRQRYQSPEGNRLTEPLPGPEFPQASVEAAFAAVKRVTPLQAATDSVGQLWSDYSRRVETDPVKTKALTSFFGFMLGDIMAQKIEGRPFNPLRCLRLGGYGLTIDGPIGHMWYKLLDRFVYPNDPQCTAAVLAKTAADQIIWAPVMTCVYFAFLRAMEGHPELIASTIQAKLVQTVVANYVLWPAAHFINFRFVPSQHRILYNNVVAIFWNAFLSTLSHAPTVEPSVLDALQAWTAEQLPTPLHEQAASFADTLYSATRPLHEQAAQFKEALKLLPQGPNINIPTSIKVTPTHVPPQSWLFENWD